MKRKHRSVLLVLSILILSVVIFLVCGGGRLLSKRSTKPSPQNVSIIQLIATPEKYDGKLVRVVGVGNLEFEGNAIHLSKEDLSYGTHNPIWLDFRNNTTIPYEGAKQYNGKYVIVEGIFKNDYSGLFHGAITDITRYELNRIEEDLMNPEHID